MIKDKLKLLPDKSGCYLMKDRLGNVIYVGKAKNLKNRVKSYFTGAHNAKTTLLVSEIVDFEFIITTNEVECLILENNLIKQYRPKYNIKLMDDKTYPYIHLSKEEYPKLSVVRKKLPGYLYGPYPDATSAKEIVRMLNTIYPFRKCRTIPKKECLYYHINQCLGPCIKNCDYSSYVDEVNRFLRGDNKIVLKKLNNLMNEASLNMEFEKAIEYRNQINYINKINEEQKITISDNIDRDFIGYFKDENDCCIHMFFMRNGKIIGHTSEVHSYVDEAVLENFIMAYYSQNLVPKEIVVQDNIDLSNIIDAKFICPIKGDKKKLIDLLVENAKTDLYNKRELLRAKVDSKLDALRELSDIIGFIPYRIDSFDNSNLFGTYCVSAMVVYKNGEKSKKDYRKYKVKYNKNDDYNTMKEILYRRYQRMLFENLERPDVILMDGGIIQVHAAEEVLKSLELDILVLGMKKDDKHKTNTLIYKEKEIEIDKSSKLFRLLSNIQEEVHRFAITFHKELRSKGAFSSKLDGIKGLGEVRKKAILEHFTSFEEMRNAPYDEYKALKIPKDVYDLIILKLNEDNN